MAEDKEIAEDKELIFISFSKNKTGEVAKVLCKLLKAIYGHGADALVSTFLSSQSLSAGSFDDQIHIKLKSARCGITILSSENKINAPWLMYEAGFLASSVGLNGGELVPYLFKRHIDDVEGPIKKLQNCQFHEEKCEAYKEMFKFLKNVNSTLINKQKVIDIEDILLNRWDEVYLDLAKIYSDMRDLSLSSSGDKKTETTQNGSLSLGATRIDRFSTEEQNYIQFSNDFSAKTPRELKNMFRKVLETQIDPSWIRQNDNDVHYDTHRVIVHGTRFSTFVVFTDGLRVVLFNRPNDLKNTNVENDLYDVFGAVAFENGSLNTKIKSQSFLDAEILRIEPIEGAAIEANRKKSNSEVETAVMIGVCVYLSTENLELAKNEMQNNEIEIINISTLNSMRKKLTSKAELGAQHLIHKHLSQSRSLSPS